MNLIKSIEKSMPSNLSKYELARFLYIETCKYFNYDKEYLHSFAPKYFITHLGNTNIKDIKSNEIICTTWSEIYSKLLRYFGIWAWPYYQGNHAWVEFSINHQKFYADATHNSFNDISRVHKNANIKNFYKIYSEDNPYILPTRDISFENNLDISNINQIIHYYPDLEEKIKILKSKINPNDKTNSILKYTLEHINLTGTGFIEDIQYLDYIFKELDKEEKRLEISASYNKTTKQFLNIISTDEHLYLSGESISVLKEKTKDEIEEIFNSGFSTPNKVYGITKEHR